MGVTGWLDLVWRMLRNESTGGCYWLVRATLEDVTLESGSLEDGES